MNANSKIYVAGHTGLTGSAVVKTLRNKGYTNLIFKTHEELDLTNQVATQDFFKKEKPEYVFLCAAKVGGIVANNTYRADFIYKNLMIQNNVVHSAYLHNVTKLLFLGTTCIYPKNSPQPIKEECLLTSELEYTNEPYAIAKIAGLKMCEAYNLQYKTNFISAMPTGIYGENDNFNLQNCHVLPALLRKFHLAKLLSNGDWDSILNDIGTNSVAKALTFLARFGINDKYITLWGSGKARREFLYSIDMADALIFIMQNVDFADLKQGIEVKNTHINIGYGEDVSIRELAFLIREIVGFKGGLKFDTSKPDGTYRKLPDCSKLENLGWKASISLECGIKKLYEWYQQKDSSSHRI